MLVILGLARATRPKARLVFVDEAGSNIAMSRDWGWEDVGVPLVATRPDKRGSNITMVAALDADGLVTLMTVEGSCDGLVFRAFVEQLLLPELKAGDIVVWDNLNVHKNKQVAELLRQAGIRLEFLPPYSPDFSPIELCWSKLKAALKKAKARTLQALEQALAHAIDTVTAEDCRAWFSLCGYPSHWF